MADNGIRSWFLTWERFIRAVDYDSGRRMFADDVVGFGTHMQLLLGLDELVTQQWRSIWGNITDFRFDPATILTGTSEDGLTGWGLSLWTSTGYDRDHSPFERPGRVTVLLERSTTTDDWLAVHTHLSLVPGTPARTYGPAVR